MSFVLRKLQFFRNLFIRRKPEPALFIEEKWIADFSSEKQARFDIKSESSCDANLRKNLFSSGFSLVLALKKEGCIAWAEAPERRYRDMVLSGAVRINARGGYGAAGLFFRMVDSETYYSFLISSKGYFRLDAVRNRMPFPLVGWTELPLSTGEMLGPDQAVDFSIIAHGYHIIILIRGHWAAEVKDNSLTEGTICFAAASYESGDPTYRVIQVQDADNFYTAEAFLEFLTLDSRITEVTAHYEKWHDSSDIDSKVRLNLAETFTAMDQHNAAMVQLEKAWETPGHRKSQKELLLAGRLAQQLGLMTNAENYISQCFQANLESPEGKEAITEMAKILYSEERFRELRDYCTEAVKIKPADSALWTFKGHSHWNLKENKNAAIAYDQAIALDKENGILAKNAANVYDVMGRKKEALERFIEAGRIFLKTGNNNDLGLLIPTLNSLGSDNWEARSLAGKWAFAVEDWEMAKTEFKRAEELRKARRPRPPKDGAQIFLEALLLIKAGKRQDAIPLLKEAVTLEKNYALFRFRLAENLFLLDNNPSEPKMLEELNAALTLSEKDLPDREISAAKANENIDGWINNLAAQIALKKGNLNSASKHLEKAVKVLGNLPAVRINQGVLFSLQGDLNKAIEILSGDSQDDPEGIMANCAGNLLIRSGRYGEADEKYRRALAIAPDNYEYICNRASCLIELGLYGEADKLLSKAHTMAPSPAILEMISYVAVKKGEYPRAEQACLSALEMDHSHIPSLLSLGWVYLATGRKEETGEIIKRLDKLELNEDTAKSREELRFRLDELLFQTIQCVSCERSWKVPREMLSAPAIRLLAMPPDDLPAGSCPVCKKTYCIGCAKENIDSSGRFTCPSCKLFLKLTNEGLKRIIYEWAAKDGLIKKEKHSAKHHRDPDTETKGRGSHPASRK